MVVYDLECSAGHRFEGWFDDLKDLKSQIKKGLLQCPVCGDVQVRQLPSGFSISRRRQPTDQEQAARMLGRALKRYLQENFEDVGPQFAKEALKMHYGVSEPRNIRGVSTAEEEKILKDEGVNFFKIVPPPSLQTGGEDDD